MPEEIEKKTVFSLLEVTRSIQKTLFDRYSSPFWVKAEMSKLNYYVHSGHCYPEIIEKHDGKIIAQIRSNLWKDDYQAINDRFLEVLHEPLKDGIKILFLAKISFDPVYGLALRIIDIDPGYTLGDLEKEKQETLKKLKSENLYDRNKSLQVPLLIQRIAIISVETSKGYADFLNVLETNPWKYKFFHFLFPSLLQGEKAVDSIIHQLARIKKVINHFDAVAIIRGGGGDIGLSCFNNYELAKEVCLFPIPVITGIGHTTNETVVELISFTNAITPTKIAEYLIQNFHNFSVPVHNAEDRIIETSQRLLSEEKTKLYSELKIFISATGQILIRNRNQVKELLQKLNQHSLFHLKFQNKYLNNSLDDIKKGSIAFLIGTNQNLRSLTVNLQKELSSLLKQTSLLLTGIEKNVINMNPVNVLKRGYSITVANGVSIKSVCQIKENDQIETILFDGKINSIVKSIKEEQKNE